MPMRATHPASPSVKPRMRGAAPCHDEHKEISRLLAAAYLRLIRQRAHKLREQAQLGSPDFPQLTGCRAHKAACIDVSSRLNSLP
jgi:hypothetical protein